VTTPTAIVWSGLFVARLGRSRLAEFRKPAAEGGMPSGALLARVGKLGSHIGKLGSERGDDQLVMIDDRLAICVRFERRIGLDGMCGGHPAGHHADRVIGAGFFADRLSAAPQADPGRVLRARSVGRFEPLARRPSLRYEHRRRQAAMLSPQSLHLRWGWLEQ
jgi:hypothetical protein